MRGFAETCERIAATSKKLEKTAIVAEYLRTLAAPEAAIAAVFLSGRPFPLWEETTLQVGGSSLWRMVQEISGKTDHALREAYRKLGDLGAVAGAVLPPRESSLTLTATESFFRQIAAARGPAAKLALVREMLTQCTPLEAKYVVKIITGDLRIGLKESLVEEAIAKAYGSTLPGLQRANMLLGDLGETLKLAEAQKLGEARMRLFHPLGFMLASPAESAEEALSYFENALVEDKYDGIRAQAHCANGAARLFSRTRDDITESFPELPPVLASLAGDLILDGEIVAWNFADSGQALPFTALQQRLGRKKVSDKLIAEVPVAYLVFDILYANGELCIDKPLRERAEILRKALAAERIPVPHSFHQAQGLLAFGDNEPVALERLLRAPAFQASSATELDGLFEAARARGNEGLMIKDPASPYTPGRRGKSWLKMKRELATLDVVVTAVEYGHGKRIGMLSDYTFAVWEEERLVNIGKAYSGLTDAEIAQMTEWFLAHVIEDQGIRLVVEPKVVLEVAFNNMMLSDRHESGYALRFPRIVRIREDKLPEEADTIERVREIYEKQKA
ncbi:MAG: ATP-dependent DNA ligase [Acidobacteria bacterium]|nr:ATP-dependent DNA ligase [Acidobacteriota bacterium]